MTTNVARCICKRCLERESVRDLFARSYAEPVMTPRLDRVFGVATVIVVVFAFVYLLWQIARSLWPS